MHPALSLLQSAFQMTPATFTGLTALLLLVSMWFWFEKRFVHLTISVFLALITIFIAAILQFYT